MAGTHSPIIKRIGVFICFDNFVMFSIKVFCWGSSLYHLLTLLYLKGFVVL